MGYKEVINNLSDFSTSNLETITRIYNINVRTSNVNILNKAFEKIVDEGLKRNEKGINPSKIVSHEQVIDMQYNIAYAVELYKIKYNRKTVPMHFNIFHLIEDFNILNPAQIIREVLQGKEEDKPKSKIRKRLSKQEKEDLEYEEFLKKKKLEILSKQ